MYVSPHIISWHGISIAYIEERNDNIDVSVFNVYIKELNIVAAGNIYIALKIPL